MAIDKSMDLVAAVLVAMSEAKTIVARNIMLTYLIVAEPVCMCSNICFSED